MYEKHLKTKAKNGILIRTVFVLIAAQEKTHDVERFCTNIP